MVAACMLAPTELHCLLVTGAAAHLVVCQCCQCCLPLTVQHTEAGTGRLQSCQALLHDRKQLVVPAQLCSSTTTSSSKHSQSVGRQGHTQTTQSSPSHCKKAGSANCARQAVHFTPLSS